MENQVKRIDIFLEKEYLRLLIKYPKVNLLVDLKL